MNWYNNMIMEYQNISNFLDNNLSNEPSKSRTKN